ncbi:MAG TPA: hypothetical protein VER04_17905 [Polyangiaceae bacterium]|nr:hypothetical protein [Polyangiaceae bacterium]
MIDLHYWTTPNGHKITIYLEELGLPYRIVPVNIGKGDQLRRSILPSRPRLSPTKSVVCSTGKTPRRLPVALPPAPESLAAVLNRGL